MKNELQPKYEKGSTVAILTPNGQTIIGEIVDTDTVWMRVHVYKIRSLTTTEKTGYRDYYVTEEYIDGLSNPMGYFQNQGYAGI